MIKINGVPFNGEHFPNGETIFEINGDMCHREDVVFELIWDCEKGNDDLFNLMILKKYFDEHIHVFPGRANGHDVPRKTVLVCPFMPYGQADRECVFDDGKRVYTHTFKYFAQIINDMNFDTVKFYDPHSPVMGATIKNCFIDYPIVDWYRAHRREFDVLFFPDNGAMKKYTELFEKNFSKADILPYTFAYKKRDLETGKILSLNVVDPELIKGKRVLIVDDLIMRGGTYKYSAQKLKELGAKNVRLYITHIMPDAKQFLTKDFPEFGLNGWDSADTLKIVPKWHGGDDK